MGERIAVKRFSQNAMLSALIPILLLQFACQIWAADSTLAVVTAGVQDSEDGPFTPPRFQFLPGESVYYTFEVGGFAAKEDPRTQAKQISLSYEAVVLDSHGRPLAPAATGEINVDLNPEDKNWSPKRRGSFSIPSLVASGHFQLRITVRDRNSSTEALKEVPFQIGGITLEPSNELGVQQFAFFRAEDSGESLEIPAYRPGDLVFIRFLITGFALDAKNTYHISYRVHVSRPDGKEFLNEPSAAELNSSSFYPAQYLPSDFTVSTMANSPRGEYTVSLNIHDLTGKRDVMVTRTFTLE